MMKWGRRKPPSSSPSWNSSISSVFPVSWLSRFKKMSGSLEQRHEKAKEKARPKMASQTLPVPVSWKDARFYGRGGDSYWRLSFEDNKVEREKIKGGLQSVWYDSEDELESPLSSRQDCKLVPGQEEIREFNNKVSGIRELHVKEEISPRISTSHEAEKEVENEEFKVLRRKALEDQNWRKTNGRVLEEKQAELERPSDKAEQMYRVIAEKDVFEASGSGKTCCVSSVNSRNFHLNTIEEDGMLEALNLEEIHELPKEKPSSDWEKLKDLKIKELMSKSEKRKSVYISKEFQRKTKQSGKVRVYSPRTAARIECKIKALEDMKKARMKMKRKTKDKAAENRTGFDSFAVVKSSFDPQQDFRNSMIEMITEKGVRRAEDLEELLACYLTLNADEYHDLIIKVFRQVWFELKLEYSGPELQNEHNNYA